MNKKDLEQLVEERRPHRDELAQKALEMANLLERMSSPPTAPPTQTQTATPTPTTTAPKTPKTPKTPETPAVNNSLAEIAMSE
jgi:hypothetical protein